TRAPSAAAASTAPELSPEPPDEALAPTDEVGRAGDVCHARGRPCAVDPRAFLRLAPLGKANGDPHRRRRLRRREVRPCLPGLTGTAVEDRGEVGAASVMGPRTSASADTDGLWRAQFDDAATPSLDPVFPRRSAHGVALLGRPSPGAGRLHPLRLRPRWTHG